MKNNLLTIKEQLKLIHDKCPDIWKKVAPEEQSRFLYPGQYDCPHNYKLEDDKDCYKNQAYGGTSDCRECWENAIKE